MNGKCERAHQELKRCVRQAISQSGSASWPEALTVAARLVFGQLPRDDWGALVNSLRHEDGFQKLCEDDPSGFLKDLKTNIENTLAIYRENNVFHRLGMNHHRQASSFQVGDRVLYLKHAATDGPASAFHPTVEGPYTITEVSERQPALVTLDDRVKCAADQLVRYRDYDSVLPAATSSTAAQEVVELERVDPDSLSVGDFVVYRSPGNDWLFEIARVTAVAVDQGAVDVDLYIVNRSEKWLPSGRRCRAPMALVLCKIEMNQKSRITRRSRQDLKNLGVHL
ncbi:hypothetical protein FOZ60_014013 [Perkinsus olseni]|uniref:Integrase catalytic domain-containing protein n=1 Tax=Perkinsus olseni TaxID=32597 RepID=A0A7J6N9H4_PEROL|nr:hypothetical protein FOZ60_014013 [Perkinsus olseni]